MNKYRIEVLDLNNKEHVPFYIDRTPQKGSGWEFIKYNGKRYQLFSGRRTYFIDLCNPIKAKPKLNLN